jgi:PEP-CTERM motif
MKIALLASVAALATLGTGAASAAQLTVSSYDMNNGCGAGASCYGGFNYWDGNYNGSGSPLVSNSYLSGGTGALTDGVIATENWVNVSNQSGTGEYVGWLVPIYGNPLITFHLTGIPTVNSVNLYVDNSYFGGVGAPSLIAINGTMYTPTVTSISAYAEKLTVTGLSLTGSTINVQPFRGVEPWIFVSEVQFGDLASSVPEPSTWAMMLAGFAALGFAGYRRNKGAALA